MKKAVKRVIPFVLIVVLCFSMAMPAFADENVNYVVSKFYQIGTLGVGSDNDYVIAVQRFLYLHPETSSMIVQSGGCDGYFGTGTQSAVIAFQDNYDALVADGAVGRQTWTVISAELTPQYTTSYGASSPVSLLKKSGGNVLYAWYATSGNYATSSTDWNSFDGTYRYYLFTGTTPTL